MLCLLYGSVQTHQPTEAHRMLGMSCGIFERLAAFHAQFICLSAELIECLEVVLNCPSL